MSWNSKNKDMTWSSELLNYGHRSDSRNTVLLTFVQFQKGNDSIQEALKVGLADQDSETRSWARKAFWGYADHFKLESDLLLSSLDQSLTSLDTASVVSGSGLSVRSRQSSVARSNDSLDSLVGEIFMFTPFNNMRLNLLWCKFLDQMGKLSISVFVYAIFIWP